MSLSFSCARISVCSLSDWGIVSVFGSMWLATAAKFFMGVALKFSWALKTLTSTSSFSMSFIIAAFFSLYKVHCLSAYCWLKISLFFALSEEENSIDLGTVVCFYELNFVSTCWSNFALMGLALNCTLGSSTVFVSVFWDSLKGVN